MKQKQRISFMVEQPIYDRLKKCATELNKPLSDVVEIAVNAAISEIAGPHELDIEASEGDQKTLHS